MRSLKALGEADATRAIAAIRAEADRRGKAPTIAVADAHGDLIALLRADGAPLASGPIAIAKAFTAARLGKPSRGVGDSVRTKGYDTAWYSDPRIVGFAGGVPVLVEGQVAGAVGVSGLSQDEDEELAVIGATAAAAG